MSFKSLSLSVQLTVAMVTILIVIVAAIGIGSFVVGQSSLEDQIQSELETVAIEEGRVVGEALENELNILRVAIAQNQDIAVAINAQNEPLDNALSTDDLLAADEQWRSDPSEENPLVQSILSNQLSDELLRYQANVPNQVEVFVTDRRGALVATTNITSDYYQADEDWWQAAWQGGAGDIFVSGLEFDESAQTISVEFALPIRDENSQEVVGVVKSVYNLTGLINTIDRFNFGETGIVHLIDQNGNFIRPTAIEPAPDAYIQNKRIYSTSGHVSNIVNENDKDVIVGYAPVKLATLDDITSLDWAVVIEQEHSEAFASINSLRNTIVGFSLFGILGAIASTFAIGRRLNSGLESLTDAAGQLGQGNLSMRSNAQGSKEITELSESFNTMAQAIQEREADLNKQAIQLKQAHDEARAAQRIAQENSRLKSEFLATMSHELRTPMNAIEGFTSIMLKRMGGAEYNDKAERYLKKVQSNSQRLLGLINDFLDLSRIESGRLELANLSMSPAEMAHKWRDALSVLAENKGLAFEVSVDPNLPETIYGDEESLSKIVTNLVGNAVKFTEAGTVALSLEKQDGHMVLEVQDTGIGIPAHARDFIFDEFRQVDQSSKRVHGGTGLGLAIVQKLVREMGGTVSLQSEVGVGSTFTVQVPIHAEMQPA